MKYYKNILVILVALLSNLVVCQEQNLFSLNNTNVEIKHAKVIDYSIQFDEKPGILGTGPVVSLVEKVLPSLLRFLPKLFYSPSKYVSENHAEYNFFIKDALFTGLNEDFNIKFKIDAIDIDDKNFEIGNFTFVTGEHRQNKGYYYLGLRDYELKYTLAKLKPKSNHVNLVLEIFFEYYDESDLKQTFVLEPFFIDNVSIPAKGAKGSINYQLLPKMKVLETMSIKLTEVNSKKQDWDKWLGLFEKHQGKLPLIFK